MKIQLYSDIVNEQERLMMLWEGNEEAVSFSSIQGILNSRKDDDTKIELFINCKGGDCIEGWAIYDLLRQQTGCEIYATIEGECSSMASIILLAAPLENRKAYANAHLCIHNPAVAWFDTDYYERLTEANIRKTAQQILNQAESLHAEQQKILNVYVERTGSDPVTLQSLMDRDIYVDMAKAQELGFISGVLAPTTAHKNSQFKAYQSKNINQMNKTNEKVTAFNKVITALKEMVGIEEAPATKVLEAPATKVLEVTDVDGNVLTVEREEGNPQVGDAAQPDGSFVMEDGTTVTVEGGVITAITPAVEQEEAPTEEAPEDAPEEEAKKKNKCEGEDEPTEEQPTEEQPSVEELLTKIAELTTEVETLKEQLKEKEEQKPDEEAQSVLDMVANAGGKAAVEKVLNARSTFNASNTKQIETPKKEDRLGDSYIEALKAAHAAALAKIRK